MAPQRAFTPARMWVLGGLVTAAAAAAIALWPRHDVLPPVTVADSTVPPPVAAPAALTREDSLAIARAIQKKIGEQQATVVAKAESVQKQPPKPAAAASGSASASANTSVTASTELSLSMTRIVDSLRAEIQKAVLDSVTRVRGLTPGFTFVTGNEKTDSIVRRLMIDAARQGRSGPLVDMRFPEPPGRPARPNPLSGEAFAERAENMGPPRRLFVWPASVSSRWRFIEPQADSIVDRLSAELGRDKRYLLIRADTVRAMLEKTKTMTAIAESLNVDLFATLSVSVLPDTSVLWQVSTRDLSANSAFARRVATLRGERPDVLKGVDKLVLEATNLLKEQDRAPRRKPDARDNHRDY
jgi:hypothetical protein